ncbi:MAG: hypothetical protein ABI649_09030 [Gaiellaceae bacterium]
MPELELALAELGRHVELPSAPDLAARVRTRMAAEPQRREPARRRGLVIAIATLAVGLGAVFAVPQTRAAILEFFHLRGVTIERVEELPTVPVQGGLGTFLGERVTLEEARERAGYEVVVPKALGEPDEVYFQESPPGGMVSLIYGTAEKPRALFTQFRATVSEVIFKKVAPDTSVDPVTVAGRQGYWLQGAHFFSYADQDGDMQTEQVRLAGNTLLWEQGSLTLRLEGNLTKEQALEIARSTD